MTGTTARRDRLRRAHALALVLALGAADISRARAQGEYGGAPPASSAKLGSVLGLVRPRAGQPLADVTVRLDQLEREGQTGRQAAGRRTDVTGSDGRYIFANVREGSYVLTFERDSLPPRVVSVTVKNRPETINIVLGAAHGDTVATAKLEPVVVTAKKASAPVTTSLPDVRGTEIFAGKKTQTIRVDSLPMNAAQDVSRQLFARAPGANITETANSGFPSNGIGFRGLNPVQSVEMNVRQDGVNIVADLYGYPETYYTPPAEAVERVDLVRGSSSLQFGPQFGGVIDYVLRDGAPDSPLRIKARETGGSFGMFNSYLSAEGGQGKWTYFAYGQ